MTSALERYLLEDHQRLDGLLTRALADEAHFDAEAFEAFRAGLLRHIGIEERLLLPWARGRRGGTPLPITSVLRIEHAALASLLVPTPDRGLAIEIRNLLVGHNLREEGAEGLYAQCATLGGGDEMLVERMRAQPAPPLARHFDGPGTVRSAAAALEVATRALTRRAGRAPTGTMAGR